MTDETASDLTKSDEAYVKGIDGYRKLALSLPPLCVSLASAMLAFEIYYLSFFYKPQPGLYADDLIVALPMLGGSLFLVAAALAMDWVADSMSPGEHRALSTLYPGSTPSHFESAKGFIFRASLFSGAYLIFSACLAVLLFLLIAAIPIFLQDEDINRLARGTILLAGAYYATLVFLKMMTKTLSRTAWTYLILGFGLFLFGNAWALLHLLKII